MASPAPAPAPAPQSPGLPWRMASTMVMGITGIISRSILYGLNSVEVTGLQRLLDVLDSRKDIEKRQRGLLTVSNHVSVVDDPLIWGLLPLSYAFNPSNLRWTLGAHDICFANKVFANFFTYGQVLPAHRLKHSPHGGLFQPCLTQAIRLLSSQPYSSNRLPSSPQRDHDSSQVPDPFTVGAMTFSTTGTDTIPAPSVFQRNRHSWVHVFPEGLVHQHPTCDLRYFKWGVARLILESEPAPDILPMFIDGTQNLMPEDRGFPRFLPRMGKRIRVAFGEVLDYEETFGDLRRRWQALVHKAATSATQNQPSQKQQTIASRLSALVPLWSSSPPPTPTTTKKTMVVVGELRDYRELMYSAEANAIRIEVARRMREQVLKVRKSMVGYPESDPKLGDASTWAADESNSEKKYRSRVDGSGIEQD
ncbi:hypothetical protein B0H66DRAFT_355230 [Apodospora peruviana]|uniref:Tafazzin family protein n=1 Tax=Apodospora peruviana TaxID=516989 RepID=A0AAE0LZJ6_9PEZI|nr:hypothetical protein B0H66DRAFT_355230 [Apodospora peruviana]